MKVKNDLILVITSNEKESTTASQLPSFSSMRLFDSSSPSCDDDNKPLLLFPIHPSTHINQEYVTPARQIISSWNEIESIQNIDSTSPKLSK